MKRPGSQRHLDEMINSWADDVVKIGRSRAKQLIGFSVLGSIIENANSKNSSPIFAIKSGTGLTIRFGTQVRATRDIDTITSLDIDVAMTILSKELEIGWEEFTGIAIKKHEIVGAAIDPLPQRCEIKFRFRNKPFCTTIFEISRSSKNLLNITDRINNAIDLAPIKLDSNSSLLILNAHYQVAQKIHACTKPYLTQENPRVHDIYDILLLEPIIRTNLDATKQACIETFEERGLHSWPPTLIPSKSWPGIWDELDIPENAHTYEDSLAKGIKLISDIAQS